MAWPPPVLPINFTDATPQQVTHPDIHNKVSQAINDIVVAVQALQARLVPTGRSNAGRNSNAVVINSASAVDLLTVTSLACKGGDLFLVEVSCLCTVVSGNASHIMHLGIEASGGGVSHPAGTSLDTDQALLGGGSGQTLQIPLYASKVFTVGNDGTFSAGSRGWVTSMNGGSSSSMSANRCVITRLN